MTSKDLHSVTSSQVLEDGATQLDLLSGLTIDQCGQGHPRVNPSAQRVNKKEKMTSDTCGQSSSISSESANLQSFLENKLRQRLDTGGSMIYDMTWKQKTTPQGWSYYHLAALAHRTSGIGYGTWPTPAARDHKGGYKGGRVRNGRYSTDTLDVVCQLCIVKTGNNAPSQLNPRFSLWLMGYPIEWASCGEQVTL